ncbi:bifunctional 2-C-methyl-D-erythritol 4-phosphate cytidylyltransferase/2-C-methyl-D-erythritol 2,4-cyclodiphosphate synthase [Bartonella sp. B10834H15]|nr:bifunctional 2-C-methyl-D-erythritol 4-phosphate cytidylyltransferase/2-C-methyl-D-erythritol 2,4-cyclodiphosphate synthase [Bartonella choladocola]MBI0014836.1 bifunctional 2-C-methyl-D-erythritol 4-phosphate cytidylyltransferase/2-C-methyl-D-erythritol 2,4-cyclodiphosphate synthase [Bartonella sp. B10834G3]MBI0140413.1 bifunctional 2-C-methyl-D-erythritol 4-phosphate cytidylyltransferase/2-C-methyl-D-erythritol 2,4-cyclodiphosphate synthase [Bartonella choladocola]
MSNAAIILAAGRGERIGSPENGPKQYRMIAGRAVIFHTLKHFIDSGLFSNIVLVIHKDDEQLCKKAIDGISDAITIVHGGSTRQISTLCGLRALNAMPEDRHPEYVYIHDGARPFVSEALLERIQHALAPDCGILPAVAVSDTLKRADDNGMVIGTIKRDHLFGAQTPQAFPFSKILELHENADKLGQTGFTDDCALAESAGLPIKIVEGSSDNIKITWPADLALAQLRMKTENMTNEINEAPSSLQFPDVRTGNGYDVHPFETGDGVTLCGVKIAYEKKLSGHSDADVALHALTDALLATRGAGDIGTHFPPSDPQWKGASSDIFVRHAVSIIKDAGGRIANADITLIAEAPKIGPHRAAMTEKLMDMLGISADRISIKATTNEKLGFVGRKEGIAAIATATVVYPGSIPE